MKNVIAASFLLLVVQTATMAQASNDRRIWFYGFGGVGGTSGGSNVTLHAGGGGEGLAYKGLGFGAEVGFLGPFDRLNNGFGVVSTDVSYHFVKAGSNQKLVPFVTGGYSLAFKTGVANGGNVGGGVHYWVNPRIGLRIEFRDHIFSSDSAHLYGVRFGVSFR